MCFLNENLGRKKHPQLMPTFSGIFFIVGVFQATAFCHHLVNQLRWTFLSSMRVGSLIRGLLFRNLKRNSSFSRKDSLKIQFARPFGPKLDYFFLCFFFFYVFFIFSYFLLFFARFPYFFLFFCYFLICFLIFSYVLLFSFIL